VLVVVTGGTGFIGSHTVAALRRAGHRVRLLVRDPGTVAPALEPLGVSVPEVETVVGDVTDAAAVQRAVTGGEAVLHAASVYSFDSRTHHLMHRVNVHGTELVLAAARRAGADPIVHVSTFGALLPAGGRPLHPELPVGRPHERYMASKAAAERIARRYQDDGVPVTITYPMATLGPHDPHLGDQLARLRNTLLGLMPIWPLGGYPMGDVRDVADLHVAAMRPEHGPRRLFAPGRYVSTRSFLRTVREVSGRRVPAMFLPAAALLPVGLATLALQRVVPWHIPAEYGALYTCLCDPRLEPAACGPPSHPLEQTVADAVRWLYDTGRISRRVAGRATAQSARSHHRYDRAE
jgi:nucleoside-diphosphate-sugar epimerase